MKKIYFASLLLYCSCLGLNGQSSVELGRINFSNPSGASTVMLYGSNERVEINKIEGSPYLTEAFEGTTMIINISGADENATFDARFNIYSNGFEVQHDGAVQFLDAVMVQSFEFTEGANKKRFVHAGQFQKAGFAGKGFLQVLCEGNVQLLAQDEVSVKEVTKREFGKADELGYKFYRQKAYYLYIDDKIQDLKSFKNNEMEVFGSKSDQVKDFVKSKKLKFKNEEDIIAVVEFYNGL